MHVVPNFIMDSDQQLELEDKQISKPPFDHLIKTFVVVDLGVIKGPNGGDGHNVHAILMRTIMCHQYHYELCNLCGE